MAEAGLEVWRKAAQVLPPRHPVRNSHEVEEIRAALKACGRSQANLRTGQIQCQLHIPKVVGPPMFAPNGHDFAAMVKGFKGAALAHMDGHNAHHYSGGFCLMVFLEDGTKIPVLRGYPLTNHLDWAWSSDGQSLVCLDVTFETAEDPELRVVTTEVNPDTRCGDESVVLVAWTDGPDFVYSRVRLLDVLTPREVCVLDDQMVNEAVLGPIAYGAFSPMGDRLIMTGRMPGQKKKSGECARLFAF
ncbi:hypothetical protein WJX73_000284 [Symbiochloris irregularis]|uniref:Uncharacterized protein n=1 Tax=Symbiochloris irregularis TaxID=706552 RepID=A0AAW1NU74_9CHLO